MENLCGYAKLEVQRKRIICAKYHVNQMNGVESSGEGSHWPRLMTFGNFFLGLCPLGLKEVSGQRTTYNFLRP